MFLKILKKTWKIIDIGRQAFINLIFVVLILLVVFNSGDDEVVEIANQSALVLELEGTIVEQTHYKDPFNILLIDEQSDDIVQEVLLSDIIFAIEQAKHDPRIKILVLKMDQLQGGGMSKLTAIGTALNHFKESGKKVFAIGNGFTQFQYQLASYANQIFLNPMGSVDIEGLSLYPTYFKGALDKLNINTHVFRVGEFKSAVEPFIRTNMSKEAKAANQMLLDDLWEQYLTQIKHNRKLSNQQIPLTETALIREIQQYQGNSAKMALRLEWVDAIFNEVQINKKMIELVGANEFNHFNQVHYMDYIQTLEEQPYEPFGNIGLIIAKGTIYDGSQPEGDIGGDSLSDLLEQARFDSRVKAVVLRVDSPGGSAFASEKIRQQVLALKEAGKPVVVSMSSMAASGGYWISMDANYIYATPTTLTGSIGVFAMIPTFEKSLSKLGITTDGVATTSWAGSDLSRGINPTIEKKLQMSVEHTYQTFITLVSKARNIDIKAMSTIAEGRVWSGSKAKELGLVDELGDIDRAIYKAAELAKLEKFDTQLIEQQLSTEELFLKELFSRVKVFMPHTPVLETALMSWFKQATTELKQLSKLNDPNYIYALCGTCSL